jgi:hypothetical protein
VSDPQVYIALIHYPVYNKRMEVITTSVTNLDLHDISRAAYTYQVKGFYVVHPLASQRELIHQILDYWQNGYGGQYNPDRREAFQILRVASSISEVLTGIREETGSVPRIATTDARIYPNSISYRSLREEISAAKSPYLLMFGTGWGLEKQTMLGADYILEPIAADRPYNHLSVRSATAITLDRLLGDI